MTATDGDLALTVWENLDVARLPACPGTQAWDEKRVFDRLPDLKTFSHRLGGLRSDCPRRQRRGASRQPGRAGPVSAHLSSRRVGAALVPRLRPRSR